jgi:hypothetical protein
MPLDPDIHTDQRTFRPAPDRQPQVRITMTVIRRMGRAGSRLAAVVAVLLAGAATAPAAFATLEPPPGLGSKTTQAGPAPVHTVLVGGTPGWQIALLAVGAAVLAAAIAVFLDRMRTPRRTQLTGDSH